MSPNNTATALEATTTPAATNKTSPSPSRGIKRPVNEHSQLQLSLEALRSAGALLALDVTNQKVRLAEVATLTDAKARALEALDAETIGYEDSSSQLAVLDKNIKVLTYHAERRGNGVLLGFQGLRESALELKRSILTYLDKAAGQVVADRQDEIAEVIRSWGGLAYQVSPLPLKIIAGACPLFIELEQHRLALEAVTPNDGLPTLLNVARAAVGMLATMSPGLDRPALPGGYTEPTLSLLCGWDGSSARMDVIGAYRTDADAAAAYAALHCRSGFAGMARIARYAAASPEQEFVYATGHHEAQDVRQLRDDKSRWPATSGNDPIFLDHAAAWIA